MIPLHLAEPGERQQPPGTPAACAAPCCWPVTLRGPDPHRLCAHRLRGAVRPSEPEEVGIVIQTRDGVTAGMPSYKVPFLGKNAILELHL